MPITSQAQYQEAQDLLESGKARDAKRLGRAMRLARMSNPQWAAPVEGIEGTREFRNQAPEEAPPEKTVGGGMASGASGEAAGAAAQHGLEPPTTLKQDPPDEWTPQRPLTISDYIPGDVGGNLLLYRDAPVGEFQKRAAAFRQQVIQKGMQADQTLRRSAGMIPPEAAQALAVQIKAGRDMMDFDPATIDENSPEYRQYVDSQWDAAKSEQQKRGEQAQPMRRIRDTGWLGTKDTASDQAQERLGHDKLYQFLANVSGSAPAFSHGAIDSMSLGLGKPVANAFERLGGEGQDTLANAEEERHPVVQAVGQAAGMMSPIGLGGRLFRGVYGAVAPAGAGLLQRLGAGALAGGVHSLVSGAGNDVASGQTDQTLERSLGRGLGGAATGLGGQLLTEGGGALKRGIELRAAADNGGKSVFQTLEEGGYKFDPIRGTIEPPAAKELRAQSLGAGESSPAERVAMRARGPILEGLEAADRGVQQQAAAETEAYLRSTRKEIPIRNTWDALLRNINKIRGGPIDDSGPLVQRLAAFSDIDAVGAPPKGPFPKGKYYVRVSDAKTYGVRSQDLSPDTQLTIGNLDEIPDNAWLEFRPRRMNARDFTETLARPVGAKVHESNRLGQGPLADAWADVERAALLDRQKFPVTKPVADATATVAGEPQRGFAAQQYNQSQRIAAVEMDRKLMGAPSGMKPEDMTLSVGNRLQAMGTRGSSVETEKALEKYAPPDILKEIQTLKAMNTAASVGLQGSGNPPVSHSGMLSRLWGSAKPRLYAVGKGLSADLPDNYPISDKLFSWLNARAPRTTAQFAGATSLVAEVKKLADMQNRPKFARDLTPEQKAILETLQ